jgi:hypothetical protein
MARSTTRWTLAGCMALAAMGAAAMLDVGAATAEAASDASPFAGSWSGTFTITDSVDPDFEGGGTFDWSISDTGRITGTFYVDVFDHYGTFVGHVGEHGELMVVMHPEGRSGFPHDGTAEIDGDGNLLASATDTFAVEAGGTHTWSLVATLESD